MTSLFLNNLQDLAEIQKVSFFKFILHDIKKIFKRSILGSLFSFLDGKKNFKNKFYIFSELVNLKLIYPKYNYSYYKNNKQTYNFIIKVPIIFLKDTIVQEKYLNVESSYYYGQIPFLTSDGTFLINGCERIVINQITKKPGIIFRKMLGLNNQPIYTGTIISSDRLQTCIYLDEIDEGEKAKLENKKVINQTKEDKIEKNITHKRKIDITKEKEKIAKEIISEKKIYNEALTDDETMKNAINVIENIAKEIKLNKNIININKEIRDDIIKRIKKLNDLINCSTYEKKIDEESELNENEEIQFIWKDIFYISKINEALTFEESWKTYSTKKSVNFKQFIELFKIVSKFKKLEYTFNSFEKDNCDNVEYEKFYSQDINDVYNKNLQLIFLIFKLFKKKYFKLPNKKHCLIQILLPSSSILKDNDFQASHFLHKEEKNNNFIQINQADSLIKIKNYFANINTSVAIDKSQILKLYKINSKFQALNSKYIKFDTESYSAIFSNKYKYDAYVKNLDLEQEIFNQYFFSDKFYLGSLGRDSFDKRFGSRKLIHDLPNLPILKYKFLKDYITVHDFVNLFTKLYDIKYNYDDIDNVDDLDYKQIRACGEFLKYYLEVQYLQDINENILPPSIHFEIANYRDDSAIYTHWDNSTNKSQFKIVKYFDLNYVNCIIPAIYDFFINSQIAQYADQINPLSTLAHKRKLSLFGPNGLERERISLNLRNINPTQFNKICPIETSEGRNAGVVTTLALMSRISKNLSLESPYIFIDKNKIYSSFNLAFLTNAHEKKFLIGFENYTEKFKKFSSLKKNILVKKNLDFLTKNIKDVNFLVLSPIQILSLGISLIPFVEHNDGNRALMGANMQRQAVPLLNSNRSIVGVNKEYNIALDSKFVLRSYSEGIIKYIDNHSIFLYDTKCQFLNYRLPKIYVTNQYLTSLFKPVVWVNEKLFSGEIIASANTITENELTLGCNLTIAYMSWEGYNFEDAIVINEKLLTNNILTSLDVEIYELPPINILNITFLNNDISNKFIFHNYSSQYPYKYYVDIFDSFGIIKEGSYVTKYTPLVRLLKKHNHFTNNDIEFEYFRYSSPREGRLVKVKGRFDENYEKIYFKLYIVNYVQIEVGDKLSGRHGNKGIISRILPHREMPYLPDGDTIDLIVNPLGVPSRMNIGQLFECLLGISGEKLGLRYKVFPFDETISKQSSRILVNTFMFKSLYKLRRSWFYNNNLPGKIFLKDGRTGEYYDNAIIVGKSYILKLIHLVEHKIHVRAVGPYNSITEQPVEGRANFGGQRFGEMEVWALEAYGSSFSLQELLTIKSDNFDTREEIYLSIKEGSDLPKPVLPEIFLLLINEFRALALNNYLGQRIKSNRKVNIFKQLESLLKLNKCLSSNN